MNPRRWMTWAAGLTVLLTGSAAHASEADLRVPDLAQATFFNGSVNGHALLLAGIAVCILGLGFGIFQYSQLRAMPVHKSMLEISELIYETCKQYLVTQGKFLLLLECFIGAIMLVYFGLLRHYPAINVALILL